METRANYALIGLFTFVVLTAILIHRKSHESRDDQDRMEQEVQEILKELREVRKAVEK